MQTSRAASNVQMSLCRSSSAGGAHHPLPELWHVSDGVDHAAHRQQVRVLGDKGGVDDAAPVVGGLEVRVLPRGQQQVARMAQSASW